MMIGDPFGDSQDAFIPFTAQTRMSGVDWDGQRIRKGAPDAIKKWVIDLGGADLEEGDLVAAPFTHAEIAQLIGSTRETVTLILGKLKREGLLGFDRRRVVIRDRAGLADLFNEFSLRLKNKFELPEE